MTNLADPASTEVDIGVGPEPRVEDDADLLRRHAPILRLDGRELFRPCPVDGYVTASTLTDATGRIASRISADRLDDRWGVGAYLTFIGDDDRRALLRSQGRRVARRVLASRLGRVGMFGRLVDALFLLSVWVRPCTPRLTTPAAAAKAERLGLHERRVTYGRVVQAGEWTVLHYAWFYVMNDWRTSYRGLNDHEADWEQAWIYCDPHDRRPIWVATSSHDLHGGDLRRHWDDPEVEKRHGRPVLSVAAGSHALFFRPGDYVTRIDVPSLRWAMRVRSVVRRALAIEDPAADGAGPALGVPFIDSAGGDGEMVDDAELRCLASPAWADGFRGLWGLDTGDPLQGERGPSGPKFDRRGEIRTSWADPLGFVGLHGTLPPSAMAHRVSLDKIDAALGELDVHVRHAGRVLPLLHQTPSANELGAESARMSELLRQHTELSDLRRRIAAGRIGAAGFRDHLRRPAIPIAEATEAAEGRWLVAAWAALTVPVLLAAAGVALLSDSLGLITVAAGAVGALWLLEQLSRGRIGTVLRLAALELSALGFGLFAFGPVARAGPWLLGVVLVAAASGLLLVNLTELEAIRRTRRASTARRRGPRGEAG